VRQAQLFNGWTRHAERGHRDFAARRNATIGGERKEEKGEGDKAARTERFAGKFRRSISLRTRVDSNKVSATYRDGILTVTLPKAEEAKPKQIQVNVS